MESIYIKNKCCVSHFTLIAAAALPLFMVVRADAQSLQPAGSSTPTAGSSGIAEIVVTATRRAERLSRVAASVTALNQAQLDVKGVRQIQDIVSSTPGITFSQAGANGAGNETVSIRGIISKSGPATTGVYLDDTPIQSIGDIENSLGSAFPKVFDLDRVEVLRGPQGTLFGGGAEGGVVRFITPQPSLTDYTAYVRSAISGTQDGGISYEGGAAVGGPIVADKLGFRVSAWQSHDGGYVDSRPYTTGLLSTNTNWSNSTVMRAALTFVPIDDLKITPSLFYQRRHANNFDDFWPDLSNRAKSSFVNGDSITRPSTDFFYLPTLNVGYEFQNVKLISVSSYYYRSGRAINDSSNTLPYIFTNPADPAAYLPTVPDHAYFDKDHNSTEQRTLTEELRLQSTDSNARFRWTAGVYYQRLHQGLEDNTEDPYLNEFASDYFQTPTDLGLLPGSSSFHVDESFILDQLAGFGSVDYKIVDGLTATVGLRVTNVNENYSNYTSGPLNGGITANQGSVSEVPVTPKFGLAWQVTPDELIYTSAAKGFRSGGVNVPVPQSFCGANLAAEGLSGTPPTYQSDTTWSYELGTKNRILDGRLRYDASVYHIDWTGVQLQNYLPCQYAFTTNAGSAVSNGFDVSIQARPIDSLTLGLNFGYDDAHFTATQEANGIVLAQNHASIGDPISANVIPPWTASFTAQYDLPIYEDNAPYIWGEYDYHSQNPGPFTSRNPSAAVYDPTIPIDPTTNLVKLRAGAQIEGVSLSLFVDNLLNSHPQFGTFHQVLASPVYTASTFRPRTIGLQAIYRY